MVQKSGDHHMGCIKNTLWKYWDTGINSINSTTVVSRERKFNQSIRIQGNSRKRFLGMDWWSQHPTNIPTGHRIGGLGNPGFWKDIFGSLENGLLVVDCGVIAYPRIFWNLNSAPASTVKYVNLYISCYKDRLFISSECIKFVHPSTSISLQIPQKVRRYGSCFLGPIISRRIQYVGCWVWKWLKLNNYSTR